MTADPDKPSPDKPSPDKHSQDEHGADGQDVFARLPVGAFLDALAAGSPAPAGGSAAALALAQAAALCAKSARLSARQLTAERAAALTDEAQQILATAASLIDEDPRAYQAVIEVIRRPAGGGDAAGQLAAALSEAAEVPMRLVELAVPVAGLAAELAADGNPALRGDTITAALLAHAAARSAAALVSINLADAPGDPRPARAAALLAGLAPRPR